MGAPSECRPPPLPLWSPLCGVVTPNHNSIPDSPRTFSVASTMEQLADYEARGFLSRNDFLRLRDLANRGHLLQVQEELDRIETTSEVSTASSKPSSILYKKSAGRRNVQWSKRFEEKLLYSSQGHEEEPRRILEPTELGDTWNENQLQELFVEMCFFARLGFVQPPRCLPCTYRESLHHQSCESCDRWVVWRKDATTLLHPHRLEGNLVIVQCQAAKKLLQGQVVEGRRWNPTTKALEEA